MLKNSDTKVPASSVPPQPVEPPTLVSQKKRKSEKEEEGIVTTVDVKEEVVNSRKRVRRSSIRGADMTTVLVAELNKMLSANFTPLNALFSRLVVESQQDELSELSSGDKLCELTGLKPFSTQSLEAVLRTNPAVLQVTLSVHDAQATRTHSCSLLGFL